ncbi:MAG TPA: SPOR domain-containing protein [Bryobacteraceae bacterium]|nr:SPOR domain-containing protein [Bryobacteraceae bacterium]
MSKAGAVPESQDNNFEMTLGNRELLGVLTVVVVMLGVFFGMGYVVGRSSAPVEAQRVEPYVATQARSAIGERTNETSTPSEQSAQEPSGTPSSTTTIITEANAQPDVKPDSGPASPAGADPDGASVAQPKIGETYVQVMATAKPEAELITEMLTKRGFRAHVAEGPDEKLFRVLVGPATDPAVLAKWKADLIAAGFTKSFVKKY